MTKEDERLEAELEYLVNIRRKENIEELTDQEVERYKREH